MRILPLFIALSFFSCKTEVVEPTTTSSTKTENKVVNNKAILVITGKHPKLSNWGRFYFTHSPGNPIQDSQTTMTYRHGQDPITVECFIGGRESFDIVFSEIGYSNSLKVRVYADSTVYY
jgi:hypothetical protein